MARGASLLFTYVRFSNQSIHLVKHTPPPYSNPPLSRYCTAILGSIAVRKDKEIEK